MRMKIVHNEEFDADGKKRYTLCVVEGKRLIEQVEDCSAGRTHLFNKYQKEDMENNRWCGNASCSSSTGIHDGITCGSGRLSLDGYWEHPCRVCAAAFDAEKSDRMERLVRENGPPTQEDPTVYLWAELPAWPYEDTNIKKESEEIKNRLDEIESQWDEFDELFGLEEDFNE